MNILCVDRRHHLCGHRDNDDITGTNSINTATRNRSELYDSFTPTSKYCVAKTLLLADMSDSSDFTPQTIHRHTCQHHHQPQQHRCAADGANVTSPTRSFTHPTDVTNHHPLLNRCADAASRSRDPGCECCPALEQGGPSLPTAGGYVVCNHRSTMSSTSCRTHDDVIPEQHQHYYVVDRCRELLSEQSRDTDHDAMRRSESVIVLTTTGPTTLGPERWPLVTQPSGGQIQRPAVDHSFTIDRTVRFKDDLLV